MNLLTESVVSHEPGLACLPLPYTSIVGIMAKTKMSIIINIQILWNNPLCGDKAKLANLQTKVSMATQDAPLRKRGQVCGDSVIVEYFPKMVEMIAK